MKANQGAKEIHDFAHNVREARRSAGLNIVEAAKKSGLRSYTWQKIESGLIDPTLSQALRISYALKINISVLCTPPKEENGTLR